MARFMGSLLHPSLKGDQLYLGADSHGSLFQRGCLARIFLRGSNGIVLGGYFVAFSMSAGRVFPVLMGRYRGGIACAFSLHRMFYVATGALCRLCPSIFAG